MLDEKNFVLSMPYVLMCTVKAGLKSASHLVW
jgi:hypothetical protein